VTLFVRRGAAAQLVQEVQQKRKVRGRLVAVRIVRDDSPTSHLYKHTIGRITPDSLK
jgi:regulator of RNase E activity RraA